MTESAGLDIAYDDLCYLSQLYNAAIGRRDGGQHIRINDWLKQELTKRNPAVAHLTDSKATELENFIAMLTRAGIGHGTRDDHPGTGVQVEVGSRETDWLFDADGKLDEVLLCE